MVDKGFHSHIPSRLSRGAASRGWVRLIALLSLLSLLLYTLSSADAFPYTVNPIRSTKDQQIIRGRRAAFAHHDPRPCLMPPDWSAGYTSIFVLQQQDGRPIEAVGAGMGM